MAVTAEMFENCWLSLPVPFVAKKSYNSKHFGLLKIQLLFLLLILQSSDWLAAFHLQLLQAVLSIAL